MNVSFRFVGLCVILAALASGGRAEPSAAPSPESPAAFAAQVEAQWLSPECLAQARAAAAQTDYPVAEVLDRGRRLADDLAAAGVDVAAGRQTLAEVEQTLKALPADAPADARRTLYLKARWAVRKLALANPLLDFDAIVFAKHAPTLFPHMSDQYYGWWSRPGGGIFVLEGFKGDSPRTRCLTASLPDGSFLRPDLSRDGKRVLFAHAKYYPHVADVKNKVAKDELPEDAFYHLYEVNVDGTGLRQITRGRYDDFDGRYMPNGEIVFLSTRRGQAVQCTPQTAAETLQATMPDSYVRCGGGAYRPVSVYTLHTIERDGKNLRTISPFENFEWTPSVADDGRILYARWDYVDRNNMPYMKLWATNPDGSSARAVWGNFTTNPQCAFEAQSIPNSHKIIMTASAHHSITGGSLVVLDPAVALDGQEPLARLTPEVCFPEAEGWPATYYASPWPLSEKYYLAAWSNRSLPPHCRTHDGDKRKPPNAQPPLSDTRRLDSDDGRNPANAQGLYLYDAFRNLELLYRDPAISSLCPIPLKARAEPPLIASTVAWDGPQEGKVLVQSVYFGLSCVEPGTVKRLRIVAVPAKVQPEMNSPVLGVTRDDPGKCVLGTVPVEEDGSAYFRVPSGVSIFFQALDGQGKALQTMRTVTYVQPGQTLSCLGCHDRRDKVPPPVHAMAVDREPSKITPGPEGSWPLRFDRLVQPVLDKHCVSCHRPDAADKAAAKFDLTAAKAYQGLVNYGGKESVHDRVLARYMEGRSKALECDAAKSPLTPLLLEGKGHYGVKLRRDDVERLFTWMDTYGQQLGSFSADQESQLLALRKAWSDLLEDRR
ncbi:MAG: hypothetical protein NTY65_10245 [Planctomycetota bacterium]|nr:hypothetical protein [Planctomycetota bacterium]